MVNRSFQSIYPRANSVVVRVAVAFTIIFLFLTSLRAAPNRDQEVALSQIYSFLSLGDSAFAVKSAREALELFPPSEALYTAVLQAFAQEGEEREVDALWREYQVRYPESARGNRFLQELIAWGIIAKGAKSSSPLVRFAALVAGFSAADAKSIPLLSAFCRDRHIELRRAAVVCSSTLRDAALADLMPELLQEERQQKVRLAIIRALGKMQLSQCRPQLIAILAEEQSTFEEKNTAIGALLKLYDAIDREQLLLLSQSKRAGLRRLSCELIAYLNQQNDRHLLIPLLDDISPEVRASALYALSQLAPDDLGERGLYEIAKASLADRCPEVAVIAAHLATIALPHSCSAAFSPLLYHSQPTVRIKAAAALAATGQYGSSFAAEQLEQNADPFVKLNLALGLLRQRISIDICCKVLAEALSSDEGHWDWDEHFFFQAIIPRSSSGDAVAGYNCDQLVRLELLNLLAIMRYPGAQTAIESFLKHYRVDISAVAVSMLMSEGDRSALALVESIAKGVSGPLALESQLVMALWGRDAEAVALLEKSYDHADRETKERILEAIGRSGGESSLPFLLSKLSEPQPILRIIAAGALLQCLYR